MEAEFVSESRVDMVLQRGPSSRFKGVSLLKSGNWGARISYMYKPYWLGAYQMEEEAAIAYDRAAVKLQRGDTPLNFHWSKYSAEESIFQSQYSTEEILSMLKDKTYSSKLMNFLSSHSSGLGTQTTTFMNEQGISYHLLFQKELTHRDVTHKCFLIPREFSFQYLPLPEGIINAGEDEARMNNLNQKDIVMFYRCEYEGEVLGREVYMIDYQRRNGENYVLEHSSGSSTIELEADCKQKETKKGFKLFGVEISG
ncbi:AP2/ERF and B3 domain-containing transcription factor At1g51120-like [Prunus avium]|uniref:AP2/ERF and B3 domain-containing transcription factor At1g51120-like n=1 Tax=Prunus avium TaxID=42229 RepID=A0A6P5SH03_PRUAV|nr:AP2/ERF and B3 domain-containing transcription factor At1g51120-like [Prunus avium]